jgi:putative acetyltransferase
MNVRIRPDTAADLDAIRAVHRLAFGGDEEARLVDALRAGGYSRISLVAEVNGAVAGHILFSDLPIRTEKGTVAALSLAPLAVLPEFQKKGIGSALTRQGLQACREAGHRIIVVLGHPDFYPRFGFSATKAQPLQSPFSSRESWMALELVPGALDGVTGWVEYPPPFGVGPHVRLVGPADQAEWLRMRTALWPDGAAGEHAQEIATFLRTQSFSWSESLLAWAVFVAVRPAGGLCGFVEASLRPHVDGCLTRPVGYVEGWYVDPDVRRMGIGRKLVQAAEQWAAAQGCQEMASDCHLENTVSYQAHRALGFEESSRLIHFRKRLGTTTAEPARRSVAANRFRLLVEEGAFAVCRLASASPLPAWATGGAFFSITGTAEELSVVCREAFVPEGMVCERDWRCLRVAGPLAFSMVGVLSSLTAPLAKAGISVFAVSTFDTDYMLVKAADVNRALAALRTAGHEVDAAAPPPDLSSQPPLQ